MIFHIPKNRGSNKYYLRIILSFRYGFSIERCEDKNYDLNKLLREAIKYNKKQKKRKKVSRMKFIVKG